MNIEDLNTELELFLIEEKMKDDEKRRLRKIGYTDNYYHPSSLYGCKRKVLFSTLCCKKEKSLTPQSLFRLDTGSYNHRRWNDYWRQLGVLWGDWYCLVCEEITEGSLSPENCIHCGCKNLTYNEIPIRDKELKISAIADGILILDRERVLWEFKTINEKDFKSLKEPKPEHFFQANIYANMLDIKGKNIWIKYENKNTQLGKDFFMEKDVQLFRKALKSIEVIEDAIENQKLLKREFTNKNIPPCLWCDYSNQCFKTNLTFKKVLDSVN